MSKMLMQDNDGRYQKKVKQQQKNVRYFGSNLWFFLFVSIDFLVFYFFFVFKIKRIKRIMLR